MEEKNPLNQKYLRLPREGGKLDGSFGQHANLIDEAEDLLISQDDIQAAEDARALAGEKAQSLGFGQGDRVMFHGDECIVLHGPDHEGMYDLYHKELGMQFLASDDGLTLSIETPSTDLDQLQNISTDVSPTVEDIDQEIDSPGL